jgi:hypothetical protein
VPGLGEAIAALAGDEVVRVEHVGWWITLPIGGRDTDVFYELDNPNIQDAVRDGHAVRAFKEIDR